MTTQQRTTHWDVSQAAASLNELAYFERASAHVIAGWLPKIPDMDLKVELAQHFYQHIDRATQLRKRLTGLLRTDGVELPVRHGWQRILKRIDAASNLGSMFAGLYQVILPRIRNLYNQHTTSTAPVGDLPSIRLIAHLFTDVDTQCAWGMVVSRRFASTSDLQSFLHELEILWESRSDGPDLTVSDALWQPLDRVPIAARSKDLVRCDPGSLGLLTADSVHDPRDVGIFLHSDLDEEYTTLELMARNSYEHPDMPWQFHVDMARQVSDEARHALMISQLMESRGFHYGDFPINIGSYDGLYQFEPCIPGSRKELLWRMLIRQTFMEGLALDSLALEVKRRSAAGQHDIVRTLDFILRDEAFHVASGLRWSAHLLGDDRRAVLQERYESLTYFTKRAEALRAAFVENNVEKAMGELAIIEEGKRRRGGKPPERTLNRKGRIQAGFSDDDILQVLMWGYATE